METHINDQWDAGIGGLLIAGTMGQMQMLPDETYHQLIKYGVEFSKGKGEIMVGVGDASLPRTLDRIRYAQQFDAIDSLVALAPYMWPISQKELHDYFWAVADYSKKPIFIYDLPGLTRNGLDNQTVLKLAKHPNISGIKHSVNWDQTRQLMDLADPDFRIIPAQPFLIDHLIRLGVQSNLDGIYAVFPRATVQIAQLTEAGDYEQARQMQSRFSRLLSTL